jgi:hypothetical protein
VAGFPALDAPVASVYLHRRPIRRPVPIATDSLWLAVEPARIGRRELVPVTGGTRVPAGFVRVRALSYHGFGLVELRARSALAVTRQELGRDVLGDPPALLIRITTRPARPATAAAG